MQNEHLWNKGLKVPSNEHLQENRGGGVEREAPGSLGESGNERSARAVKKSGRGRAEVPGPAGHGKWRCGRKGSFGGKKV